MSKPKILAASWHTGGMNAIIPVIRQMRQDSLVDVIVIGHDVSLPLLKQAGIEHQTIQDYSLSNFSVLSMQRLLQLTDPNLVLTGTSVQDDPNDQHKNKDVLEQTITSAARESRIPSLSVLDFWGNYYQRFTDIYTNERFKFLPTMVAIMDKYAEKEMLDERFPKDRLRITGNPHFDNLEQKANSFTQKQKQEILSQIKLNKELLIFYAANVWKQYAQEYGFWDLDNISLINEAISRMPDKYRERIGLVVKLHPRTPQQSSEEIKRYIDTNNSVTEQENIRLVTDIHPQNLVLACDLTLTPNSTVGFEAVYMHKPCISIQPGLKTKDYLAILTQNKLIQAGYTTNACIDLIQRAVTDENYRNGLVTQASSFRTDGKATQRVTNLVYEMLG